jgi:hypothetical protein
MSGKKIALIILLVVLVLAGGYYLYVTQFSADTAGAKTTTIQAVDSSGKAIKQQVPLLITFKGKSRFLNQSYVFTAVTDANGSYNIGKKSYRPLTKTEAKQIVVNLVSEKIARALTDDEANRVGRVVTAALALKSVSASTVSPLVVNAFKGYVPATTTTASTATNQPISASVTTATTSGATVTADSSAVTSTTVAAGSTTSTSTTATTSTTTNYFATDSGLDAITSGVVIATLSTRPKIDSRFDLSSIDITATGAFTATAINVAFGSKKYKANMNLVVNLSEWDVSFYQKAVDALYNKFISSNASLSDIRKKNYLNLLSATVKYLTFARLYNFTEADNNADIAAIIKGIVDNDVATGAYGVNTLSNGTFENGSTSWSLNQDNGQISVVSSSDSFKCAGDTGSCIKLVSNNGTNQHIVQQVGKLVKGKKYVFSADFLATEGYDGQINIYDNTNKKGYGLVISGNGVWKTATVSIPVPDDSNDFYVFAYGDKHGASTGTVYYDNLSFAEVN